MNLLVIFLATLLVVIIAYMLFSSYFSSTTTLSSELDMKDKIEDITVSKLSRPDATRYSYNVWLYVDKPLSGNESKIYDRAGDLGLYLNGPNSNLSMKLHRMPGASNVNDKTYQISNNFPLQKWVFVTISVDNSTIDIYLDGKLIKSVIDVVGPGTTRHLPDATSSITFGVNPGTYMAKFSRTLSPSDPQTAWSAYMAGSGSKKGEVASVINELEKSPSNTQPSSPVYGKGRTGAGAESAGKPVGGFKDTKGGS